MERKCGFKDDYYKNRNGRQNKRNYNIISFFKYLNNYFQKASLLLICKFFAHYLSLSVCTHFKPYNLTTRLLK